MYCIISVSFSTKCHLFSFFQIILSSCLSHELKFKSPPESVEVQDIMEVTFQQINIQFFTCLLPGRKMLPQSGSDSRRGWTCCCCWVVLGVIGIYATEVFFFCVCLMKGASQNMVNCPQHSQQEREKIWSPVSWTKNSQWISALEIYEWIHQTLHLEEQEMLTIQIDG